MFDEVLKGLEARLDVPYPLRSLLVEEIGADLQAAYVALRERGLSERVAQSSAIDQLGISDDTLASLSTLHQPAVQRALLRLQPATREWIEALAVALPLAGYVSFLALHVPLLQLFQEGGPIIFPVLLVGAPALVLELQVGLRWLVLRQHAGASLASHSRLPLYLATASLGLGILGTLVDYRVVLRVWAEGILDDGGLRVGLREPLPCAILGANIFTAVVLIHAAIQSGLRALRVPE